MPPRRRSQDLGSVEVNSIRVNPLNQWRYLLSRQQPGVTSWPKSSTILCWWCCHSFSHVPAFLPVECDLRTSTLVFTGNFCSWNCVKRYVVSLQRHRHVVPPGAYYIGLLAYLTSGARMHCHDREMHELGLCDCVSSYAPVALSPDRECLKAFGGHLSIEDYRQGFQCITDYQRVQMCMERVRRLELQLQKNGAQEQQKWGFRYLTYNGPSAANEHNVSVLPLTNRVVNDRRSLVLTGFDPSHHQPVPMAPNDTTTRRGSSTSRRGSSSTSTTSRRATAVPLPRAQPQQHLQHGPSSTPRVACNEEQAYMTRSLRGYGNLLTCMNITVEQQPPPPKPFRP